jgi:transposase
VLSSRLWLRLFGVERAILEDVREEQGGILLRVRLRRRDRGRCRICGRRCPGYDRGAGLRRWRALDMGLTFAFVEAEAPRVRCRRHGVGVARVPWARHGSVFTRTFEDTTAWLATQCSKTAVSRLMRIAWPTVGGIVARVAEDRSRGRDRFQGLRRIGIDEVSYRRGQRYLIVVVDHDTGNLVWAAPGRDSKTLARFFDLLGEDGCAQIELVSADATGWIERTVYDRCPNTVVCLDTFHIVQWATNALDEVRREIWNQARRANQRGLAKIIKGSRYALCKNPEDLTDNQKASLAGIARLNDPLHRAYLLKEELRLVFKLPLEEAMKLLRHWLNWAGRCRLKPFVKLARTIREYAPLIETTLTYRLTNARVESLNTRLRLITRRAFGFHSAEALIGLAMLALGGLCPPLPHMSNPAGLPTAA